MLRDTGGGLQRSSTGNSRSAPSRSLIAGGNRIPLLLLVIAVSIALTGVGRVTGEGGGAGQLALPTKVGQDFIVDDFDSKVTLTDMGFNYFMGNTGATESAESITELSLSDQSNGSTGGSLSFAFDFSEQPDEGPFAGYFSSIFGLTDTLVSLDGNQPIGTTQFPDYFLDTQDIYRGFSLFPDRSVDELRFDVRLKTSDDVTLKIELRDESDFDVFTRRTVSSSGSWQAIMLSLPDDFADSVQGNGNTAPFDWRAVSVLAIIVERENVGAGVTNPTSGTFLLDNLRLADIDGLYPSLDNAAHPQDGSLLPQYTDAFLEHVRATSFLYFLDFASTDPRTGGIVQDRSTFADLMSVGGVGFQLTSYVIGAEAGYISRDEAAVRTHDVLRVLHDHPQGPNSVSTIGHKGFFYHFLGIDGLRKQNFDFKETEINEAWNTVELSTIDTALALAGVVTVMQYFDANTAEEQQIRSLAATIYSRVEWDFMLDEETNQFYLGWKPNEKRDDDSGRFGRFKLNDVEGQGQYSSKFVNGEEVPATLDFYTDEGLLVALLAIASGVDEKVFFATERQGTPFVKTFPGSLFTYQFGSVWLDTESLGPDAHPKQPINYFDNTRSAILATMQYATKNPEGRATLSDRRWGLSATEGPFDSYFAEAAPPAAIATAGQCLPSGVSLTLEGEDGTGDGSAMFRSQASGGRTVWLHAGESRVLPFTLEGTAKYGIGVRYSNDNFGPLETVEVLLDGNPVGQFEAQDTGDFGFGWNVFESAKSIVMLIIDPGTHELEVAVTGGDGFGVEIDFVSLEAVPVERPLELGTVTVYGSGSSIVHTPEEAVEALWDARQQGFLHPRFGFADAFNLEIADAVVPGCVHPDEPRILRTSGPWKQATGFAINHGPMLALIDNYLQKNFVPKLFMSHPAIDAALSVIFPERVPCPDFNGDGVITVRDLVEVARRMGSETGDRRYDSMFDLNQDGRIDVRDLATIVHRFGEPCP